MRLRLILIKRSRELSALVIYIVSLIFIFLIGVNVAMYVPWLRLNICRKRNAEKAVYMIINLQVIDVEKQKIYQAAALPLAYKAGLEFLAAGEPVVLGGDWPYNGAVVVEKFRSMAALKEYWNSTAYQNVRKLLVGADIRDFTIAIEANE